MKMKTATVTLTVEGSTLQMLKKAAAVNKCSLAEATAFLLDYGQGNLCDWSNEGFPIFTVNRQTTVKPPS